MRVVLYARVSSEKQAEQDLSIASQLDALRKFAKNKNWTIYKEFIDEAESARSANRPAFQEMISLSKKKDKPFEIILIWKFSRFARNREDAIIYKSLLRKHGVQVVSMNEQVDDSPAGKLLEGIIEVIDEFYSANLAQDTLRGQNENAKRGFHNGTLPIGYMAKKVKDGNNDRTKLDPDPQFAPLIKRIFRMSLNNTGIKEIATTLNREGIKTNRGGYWSSNKITYILKNEVYTGTLVWNKKHRQRLKNPDEVIRVTKNHQALIKKEDYEQVQKLVSARSPKYVHPREISSDNILSGLIYCGKCGLKMIGCAAKSSKFHYYACQNYYKRGKDVCDMKMINRSKIEELVIERIKTRVLTEENLTELLNTVLEELNESKFEAKEKLEPIEKHLESCKQRLGNLYNSLETGKLAIDDLAPRIKELKSQIELLEGKKLELLQHINSPSSIPFDMKILKSYIQDLWDLLSSGSIMEKKGFLRSFVKKITVHRPKITIDYTIPLQMKNRTSMSEVLSMGKFGVADGI